MAPSRCGAQRLACPCRIQMRLDPNVASFERSARMREGLRPVVNASGLLDSLILLESLHLVECVRARPREGKPELGEVRGLWVPLHNGQKFPVTQGPIFPSGSPSRLLSNATALPTGAGTDVGRSPAGRPCQGRPSSVRFRSAAT